MVNAKLGFVVILRRNIVGVKLVLRVQLVQHGGICTLYVHEKNWHLTKAIPIEIIFQSIAHFFLDLVTMCIYVKKWYIGEDMSSAKITEIN